MWLAGTCNDHRTCIWAEGWEHATIRKTVGTVRRPGSRGLCENFQQIRAGLMEGQHSPDLYPFEFFGGFLNQFMLLLVTLNPGTLYVKGQGWLNRKYNIIG